MTELLEAKLPKKDAKKTGTQVKFLYDKDVFAKGYGADDTQHVINLSQDIL